MAFEQYDDLAWHLQRLRRAREDGRLIFVLGSGINASYGLPDWSTLLVDLLRSSGRLSRPIGPRALAFLLNEIIRDPLLQAAAIRNAYAKPGQWIDKITARLTAYDRDDVLNPDKAMRKIANIVADQYRHDRHRHIPVLTFNYDDLLETAIGEALGEMKDALHSVAREETFFGSIHRSGIYVYHLHGFIHDHESDIVLDAASYVGVLASPGRHWSWHCMNMYLFQRDAAAIFLGLSLLDPSLRLLLSQAAARGLSLSGVYVSKPFPRIPWPNLRRALDRAFTSRDILTLFEEVLKELSLVPYHVSSWDEIPSLLDTVTQP